MDETAKIAFEADGITVDASLIAEGLELTPAAVQAGMRDGKITSRCERGIDDDAGRYRLTFFHGSRRLRLVVDEAGNIIQRSVVDFGELGMPSSARRPGS